nr:solute carrier family 21-like isoform X1 [Ciona intestinalis]XP_026694655.1 solute carrier family 21-like isoform X2 [Ciona intestinalis]|eukprot:XP_026694654.1 solute carrier family 21-like isoform X1 [Ciona intestinalis]
MNEPSHSHTAASPLLERPRYDRAYFQNGPGDAQRTVTLRTASMNEGMSRPRERTISAIAPMPTSCYTINMFLFFLTCFQLINLLTLTYTDSVLNYITKRFKIPNTMASFIPSSYQVGNMVVIIPISYFGAKLNRPRAIGIGVMVMVVGLGFCMLPHFILPAPPLNNSTTSSLCWERPHIGKALVHRATDLTTPRNLPCNKHATVYNPALLLILGHLLIGGGAATLWPLGVSYIDDHVVIRKIPIYIGIFIGTTLMGPVFGFLLGSVSSAIYVTTNSSHLHQTNPAWIGAWWLGYVVAAILLVLLLFPFYFYPRYLPVSPQKEAELAEIAALEDRRHMSRTQSQLDAIAEQELENVASQSEASSVAGCTATRPLRACEESMVGKILSTFADMTCAIRRTLSTPLVVTAILSYIAMANLLAGVSTFGSTYVQRMFNVLRMTSDMLIGGVCVPLGIAGTFAGGYLMKKYNFDIRQTLLFTIIFSGAGCVFLAALFGLGCKVPSIAGITAPYRGSDNLNKTAYCNYDCQCPKGQFLLVCGADKVTYISPCYAGCKHTNSTTGYRKISKYTNCSCVSGDDKSAHSGSCSSTNCGGLLALFMICVGIGITLLCFCQAPVYVVLLRVLESGDKALGIGLMSFSSRLLGYVPGPIWFGLILDRSCIYKAPACHGKALCYLYNTYGLRMSYIGLSLACSMVYMLVFIVTFVWMEFNTGKYEKDPIMIEPLELDRELRREN